MRLKNQTFWIAALFWLLFDQLTKYWTVQGLEFCVPGTPRNLCDSITVWEDVFYFIHVTNPGAAFSIGQNSEAFGWFLRILSVVVSLVLSLVAIFGPRLKFWEQLGWGCILAGALGNGIDRIVAGEVVDFLDFRLINFPVFNVADIAINIGFACLLIFFYFDSSTPERKPPRDR